MRRRTIHRKASLPEEENEKPRMSEEHRRQFDELLGIRNHGGKG